MFRLRVSLAQEIPAVNAPRAGADGACRSHVGGVTHLLLVCLGREGGRPLLLVRTPALAIPTADEASLNCWVTRVIPHGPLQTHLWGRRPQADGHTPPPCTRAYLARPGARGLWLTREVAGSGVHLTACSIFHAEFENCISAFTPTTKKVLLSLQLRGLLSHCRAAA